MKQFIFKYDIGQKVYYVFSENHSTYKICPQCNGSSKIFLSGEEFACPKCRGCGRLISGSKLFYFIKKLTVGNQRASITNKRIEEEYMCYETGVGSGTCYSLQKLFETQEQAEQYKKEQEILDAKDDENADK